eukprot:scaffold34020_cov122-Isochrysis_galbana.AAC.3
MAAMGEEAKIVAPADRSCAIAQHLIGKHAGEAAERTRGEGCGKQLHHLSGANALGCGTGIEPPRAMPRGRVTVQGPLQWRHAHAVGACHRWREN